MCHNRQGSCFRFLGVARASARSAERVFFVRMVFAIHRDCVHDSVKDLTHPIDCYVFYD
ncbi:Unannotated [Lentimonas sp. CC19]|nr:Unannotated [Lentimonas sp. CC4]CAA6686252.1 Unannotated [Lentimonas sp. CC6]CAA6694950.1 Unannotated [Lentimonas sp. CC19]CAA6695271.1 Unannotated [Lentimonas sp. CC10]CAA7071983.1 Unannotated [Lentimonas sp. CC11]CAA7171111.1 Unannotated [Lentimonas sp. CC21]CAA7180127.1 Unannotated [Lentimonas sp. CC8]